MVAEKRRLKSEELIAFKSSDGVSLCGIHRRAKGKPRAGIVLAHGICVDKDFAGFQAGLARELVKHGFETFRFDFRGHGESGGRTEDTTIAGEIRDMTAAVGVLESFDLPEIGVIGHSFGGGVSVLYAAKARRPPCALALLAPTIDFRRTFLNPETPWTKMWYTPSAMARAVGKGVLVVGGMRYSAGLIREFHTLDPAGTLRELEMPVLVVHGDSDTCSSYLATHDATMAAPRVKFTRIRGADHYFDGQRARVYQLVAKWLESKVP